MEGKGGVSGKLVVFILFTGALLLWGIVFLVGLREKRALFGGRDGTDVAETPEEVRVWLKALPERWAKVSLLEGQGWVLYVPCYSSNSEIMLRTAPDSLPGLACEYCDSLDAYAVKSVSRSRRDSAWELHLDPSAGEVRVLPVGDSLLKAFPEAPFKDRILLWTRSRAGGRVDSMVFVPKSQEAEFETLRAEDENPEGCGGDDPD
jgi:hypothetical protein